MTLTNTGMCQQLRLALSMMVTISLANCSASESVSCDNPSGRILTSTIITTITTTAITNVNNNITVMTMIVLIIVVIVILK